MFIDDALDLTYSYASTICNENEIALVFDEIIAIAGKKKYVNNIKNKTNHSYFETQNMLSKLNEKESIRKSKGVYYTPCDVVHFIVANSIKAAYGKLNQQNIGQEDLSEIPYKSFATKKTVFDPTCGAGEYLLVALEHKLEMLGEHYKTVPVRLVHEAVSTVYGNDINEESIVITKLRLLICVLKHFGTRAIQGLAELMKRNFYSYDYVMRNPNHKRYDIIVGNPP